MQSIPRAFGLSCTCGLHHVNLRDVPAEVLLRKAARQSLTQGERVVQALVVSLLSVRSFATCSK